MGAKLLEKESKQHGWLGELTKKGQPTVCTLRNVVEYNH
jgi:hypothetical protein